MSILRKTKEFCLIFAILLIALPLATAGSTVYAAETNGEIKEKGEIVLEDINIEENDEITEEDRIFLENVNVEEYFNDAEKGLDDFFTKAVSVNEYNGKLDINEEGMEEMFGNDIEYDAMINFVAFFNNDNNFNYLGRTEFINNLDYLSQGKMPVQARGEMSIQAKKGGALSKCAVAWAKNTFGVGISASAFKTVLNTYGYAKAAAWLAGKIASATGRKAAAVLTLVWTIMTCAPITAS